MTSDIHSLPRDILSEILIHCMNDTQDIRAIKSVCTRWYRLVNEDRITKLIASRLPNYPSWLYSNDWYSKIKSNWKFIEWNASIQIKRPNFSILSCTILDSKFFLVTETFQDKTVELYDIEKKESHPLEVKNLKTRPHCVHKNFLMFLKQSPLSAIMDANPCQVLIQDLSTKKTTAISLDQLNPTQIKMDESEQLIACWNADMIAFYDWKLNHLLFATETPPLNFKVNHCRYTSRSIFKDPYYITFGINEDYLFELQIIHIRDKCKTTKNLNYDYKISASSIFMHFDTEKIVFLNQTGKMTILTWQNFPHCTQEDVFPFKSGHMNIQDLELIYIWRNTLVMTFANANQDALLHLYDIGTKTLLNLQNKKLECNQIPVSFPFPIHHILTSPSQDQLIAYGNSGFYHLKIKNLLLEKKRP